MIRTLPSRPGPTHRTVPRCRVSPSRQRWRLRRKCEPAPNAGRKRIGMEVAVRSRRAWGCMRDRPLRLPQPEGVQRGRSVGSVSRNSLLWPSTSSTTCGTPRSAICSGASQRVFRSRAPGTKGQTGPVAAEILVRPASSGLRLRSGPLRCGEMRLGAPRPVPNPVPSSHSVALRDDAGHHRSARMQAVSRVRSGAGVEPTQRRVTPPHRF
jgi:hypothetical protein